MISALSAHLLLATALLAAPAASPHPREEADHLWRTLERGPRAEATEAWREIRGRAQELLPAALRDFSAYGLAGRRARADLLEDHGSIELLGEAAALAGDPDDEVRLAFVRFLEKPRHRGAAMARRIELLGRIARDDLTPPVRLAAVEALGRLDNDAAVAQLALLIDELPPRRAAVAVSVLPLSSRSLDVVRGLVVAGFRPDGPAQRTPDEVLAAALPIHGRLVADRPGASVDLDERAAWVRGLRHPSGQVRIAAADAFQAFLTRLRAVGESSRALEVLEELQGQGLDTRVTQYHRARLAFYPEGDPELAREAARAMRRVGSRASRVRPEDRLWLARSLYLEAMAAFASESGARGLSDEVDQLLDEAERVLDALIAERLDRADDESVAADATALEFRALLEVARIVVELRTGTAADDARLAERARRAHAWLLEAQLEFTRVAGETLQGWDVILDSEISPFRLVFTNIDLPGLDIDTSLGLQKALGVLLASVARTEFPGFVPLEGLAEEVRDPLADLRRRELLVRIQDARLDWIIEEIHRVTRRMVEAQRKRPWVVQLEQTGMLESLDLRRRRIARAFLDVDKSGGAELLEQRTPASLALWLSRDLRNDGRAEEARTLAVQMRDDLEANGISPWWYYYGLERLAQAEMEIGSSYTDEGVPKLAETELLRAVERLEGIERRMLENGAGPGQLEPLRRARCSALVSLAVNANVKLEQPERALGFFEQAFELRQDDFMRVLLACYRARSGRSEEARALLEDIRPYPSMYYNMACTYALLGDRARALDLLEKDFDENHPSEKSRERQKEWAAEDPDLESLRNDPAFRQLVGLE